MLCAESMLHCCTHAHPGLRILLFIIAVLRMQFGLDSQEADVCIGQASGCSEARLTATASLQPADGGQGKMTPQFMHLWYLVNGKLPLYCRMHASNTHSTISLCKQCNKMTDNLGSIALTKQEGLASLQLHRPGPQPSPSSQQPETCLVFLRQHGQPFSCDKIVHVELEGA